MTKTCVNRKEGLFMIIGTVDAAAKHEAEYPPVIDEALAFLRSQDFTKLAEGRYYPRGKEHGEEIFADVQRYETKPAKACYPEAHKKYADVQFVAAGSEYIGWCPFSPELEEHASYNDVYDITFYERLVPESTIMLKPGSFAVLYPEDVHAPRMATEEGPGRPVTKVVVKISVDLL